jgi:uncharacterized damage-inducible protein DinB
MILSLDCEEPPHDGGRVSSGRAGKVLVVESPSGNDEPLVWCRRSCHVPQRYRRVRATIRVQRFSPHDIGGRMGDESNSLSVVDERTAIIYYLDAQRRSALAIVDGLAQEHYDVSVVPSGWTVASMFEHLAGAERFWFQHVLAGQADVSEPSGTDPRSRYREQITRSDLIVESFALDAGPDGTVPQDMAGEITSARDIMLHMIEETARHAGHLDIARELLDGQTGLGPR